MLMLKRLTTATTPAILSSRFFLSQEHKFSSRFPSNLPSQWTSNRFLDFYQFGDKDAIAKERARLSDEMNRGYFADIAELKQHGGKIAMANKIIIPAMAAVKFPTLEVNYSDNTSIKLPITSGGNEVDAFKMEIPKASLLCLSFRANSQAMIDSWSVPFLDAFRNTEKVKLYEISFIDSWFLRRKLIKWLLLRMMRKSKSEGKEDVLQRQVVYSFGDHYYLRKELKILNLLTGYIFLVDNFGRIRWQGFGSSSQEELLSLMSCATLLLEEK